MILNHLIGIYTHPKEEWQTIDTKHETYFYALTHIALYLSFLHSWPIIPVPILAGESAQVT